MIISIDEEKTFDKTQHLFIIKILQTASNIKQTYLLDEYNCFAEIILFFVLYYANYTFLKRLHMSKVSVSEKTWTFSKYKDKFDFMWRKERFSEESEK